MARDLNPLPGGQMVVYLFFCLLNLRFHGADLAFEVDRL
jgi:hypothetical protein